MAEKILRGRVLRFLSEPAGIDDTRSYAYEEDGAILVRAGRVVAVGPAAGILAQAPEAEVVDHRPHLLMPGFIDAHIHMPQAQIIASWGAQLLDWLNTYTFPAEFEVYRQDPCRPYRRRLPRPVARARHHHRRRLLLLAPGVRSMPTSPLPRRAACACWAAR